ncbi:hypothetical protein CC78DRAFT_528125 [Lojkania enalia]|uniref:SMP-LTD domain-containing protein n=1 Tax=Lojkania enalia TaxID=147567 RepID=A0A9P4NDG3_9PLEO|nr:hypothetical protein CC78DRAFT_528125 [Didymosphaeria enalia]
MTISAFLLVYVLGGFTFIPLVLSAIFLHFYFTSPIRDETQGGEHTTNGSDRSTQRLDLSNSELERLPAELKTREHIPDVAAGYFAVCREYVPGGTNGKPPERTTPAGAVIATESLSVYQSMYRSIFDRNKTTSPTIDGANAKSKKARNVFYVVLRLGHLMLYDDSEQLEVRHVISLAHYDVDIYGGGGVIPEGELWIKRNCIRLSQKMQLEDVPSGSRPFYLFSENCSEKEDFYHAMLQSQERSLTSSRTLPLPLGFNAPDLVRLVQQLHASEENMHTRWINALIGRVFLAMYKTSAVENFIRTKITKKIARVPKPALISSINLRKIDMGHLPPFITNPRLRELTIDGDLVVEADVSYKGEFRIEISAIARIELGSRFKAREVTLILASILKKLEGHILVRVKPPPSNRLWVTFETPPKMELALEPIVSSRQITYGVILRAIESRIREVVNETLVLPNWDDIPFSDTALHSFRGGIWAEGSMEEYLEVSQEQMTERKVSQGGKSSESDESDTQPAKTALHHGAQSMPNLGRVRRSSSTISSNANQDIGDIDTIGISSGADIKTIVKPKAMRSGSFSAVASPVVDVNSANASVSKNEIRERRHDAASTMMAITKSQQTSPTESPVGSPSKLVTIQPGRPRSTSPDLPPVGGGTEEDSTTSRTMSSGTQDPSALLSSADSPESSSINLSQTKPRHSSSLSLPRNAFGTAEKRQTFNQSLNTATATAKKWFASRQNPETPSSPLFGGAFSRSQTSNFSASSAQNVSDYSGRSTPQSVSDIQPPLGSPAHPIGRGQPLPPLGMPLPPPSKPGKKSTGWSVPAASTFANLTKRKQIPNKPHPPIVDSDDPNIQTPSTPLEFNTLTSSYLSHPEMTSALANNLTHIRRKSSSTSSVAPTPLPSRRKRLSDAGPVGRNTRDDEGLLVVKAPMAESSVSTSPVDIVRDKEVQDGRADDGKNTDQIDEDEVGIFEGMDMDNGVT